MIKRKALSVAEQLAENRMAPRRQVKDRILPSLREKARLTRLTVIQRSTRKTVEKRPRFPWMR